MPTTLKVRVTEEHIARATRADSRGCMIVDAIKDARPDFRGVMVDLATVRWTNPRTKMRYVCLTPREAGQALVDYDQGRPIEPLEFWLYAIQKTPVVVNSKRPDGTRTRAGGYSRGPKKLLADGTISGGKSLRMGHLSNVRQAPLPAGSVLDELDEWRQTSPDVAPLNAPREPGVATQPGSPGDTGTDNVKLSSARHRAYGRRLLRA